MFPLFNILHRSKIYEIITAMELNWLSSIYPSLIGLISRFVGSILIPQVIPLFTENFQKLFVFRDTCKLMVNRASIWHREWLAVPFEKIGASLMARSVLYNTKNCWSHACHNNGSFVNPTQFLTFAQEDTERVSSIKKAPKKWRDSRQNCMSPFKVRSYIGLSLRNSNNCLHMQSRKTDFCPKDPSQA